MNDKKALRLLQKKFSGQNGLYLFETHFTSAKEIPFLKTKKGLDLRRRLVTSAFKNRPVKAEKIALWLEKENDLCPFCEYSFQNILPAFALGAICDIAYEKNGSLQEEKFLLYQKILSALGTSDLIGIYERNSLLHNALLHYDPHHYKDCDNHSQSALRSEVLRYCRKHKLDEKQGARAYSKNPPSPNLKLRKTVSFSLTGLLFLLLLCLALWWCGGVAMLLLFIPLLAFSIQLIHPIISAIFPPIPVLSLKPAPVPEHAKTLVVITALLTNEKDTEELFSKLKKYYLGNKQKNVTFGILADLPIANHAEMQGDAAVLQSAKAKLGQLNTKYGDHFCLFVRRRQKSISEKCFMGWERKRGALLDLCRAVREKENSFSYISLSNEVLSQFRYVITLDADTELSMGMVSELVFTMLHPENRPKIQDGIVISGYGVLQPRMVPSLFSATKSLFALLQTGGGGRDSYENDSIDYDQVVFGKSGFCGKGIFDIDAYLATLDGVYPDERILSHDLLESTRLRCGALANKSFTDAVPAGVLPYLKRQHRWMRGDTQSLPFIFAYHKNKEGKKLKNNIDLASKGMLLRNILYLLRPVFCFLSLVYAAFLPKTKAYLLLAFSLIHLLFPTLKTICFTIRTANRRFYSAVLQGLWHSVFDMLYGIASLAQNAFVNLDAFGRSLFRMSISHRHLLQWVTADHMEKGSKNSLTAYLTGLWKSTLTGILFLTFAPHGLLSLYGLFTLLYPSLAYCISQPTKEPKEISQKQREVLTKYATDAFLYYETYVQKEDNYLPPDNYQFQPVAALAHRTSPTNIAMYLLSVLGALDLAIITPETAYEKLSCTLDSVQSLAKFRGHLYNWYDTKTLEVLGNPYISTVDSGNFVTSLVALRQGLTEYKEKEQRFLQLIPQIDKLITECDFSFLYNKTRNLFCIGYDPIQKTQSENCYDLYMSESRTTSYYAIAKGIVPKKHWSTLGRPLIKSEGHLGLASWSGTSFEYFMPALLLPTYKNSFSYECLGYALYEQLHDDTNGIWGRSESGYYAFDGEMNYQYKAFGVPSLALDNGAVQNNVIAPYACFLTLALSVKMPLANLSKMQSMGLYGPFGFYEAVDFTPARVGSGHGIVKSYMAHHVGMTILSVVNVLCGNIFVKRFMRDDCMAAADELLTERVPANAPIPKKPSIRSETTKSTKRIVMPEDFSKNDTKGLPSATALLADDLALFASSSGEISLFFRKNALTYPNFDEKMPLRGLRLLVKTDRGILDIPRKAEKFGRYEDALVYSGKTNGISYQSAFTLSGQHGLLSLQLELEGDFTAAEPMLLSEVIMASPADWKGHPNYTSLFIESKHLPEDHALLFKKRTKKQNEKPLYFLVTLEGGGFDFLTRRDGAYPYMYEEKDILSLFEHPFDNRDGQCIMPYFAVRRPSVCPKGKFKTEFLLGAGEDADALLKTLRALRKERTSCIGAIFAQSYLSMMKNRLLASGYDGSCLRCENFLLTSILHDSRKQPSSLVSTKQDLFWRHGISMDLPMVCLVCPEEKLCENTARILKTFLKTQKHLALGGFAFDLLIFYTETEQYACPHRAALHSLVTETVGENVLTGKKRVHLLTDKETMQAAEYLCPVVLHLDKDTVLEKAASEHLTAFTPALSPSAVQKPDLAFVPPKNELLSLVNGSFHEKGYRVNKYHCKAPQSRIYCSSQFGTLLTHNSLGVTFFRNASEFCLTKRNPDAMLDLDGEKLLLNDGKQLYDLAAAAHLVDYSLSCARYEGLAGKIRYTLEVGVDTKFPVKLILLTLQNKGETPATLHLDYKVKPCLGNSRCVRQKKEGDTTFYRSLDSLYQQEEFGMYVTASHSKVILEARQEICCHFLLGVVNYQNDRSFYLPYSLFKGSDSIRKAFSHYGKYYQKKLGKWTLCSDSPALDLMFNEYIPYQALTSRIYARTGFYQSGGAYGFRDQLQDCINLLPIDPYLTKLQILRCTAHQYAEGDVQHWWHGAPKNAGMRTHCSDDLLWLPYALAEYVAQTADREILDLKVAYLDSTSLGTEDDERYESPRKTKHKESVRMHAMRALDLALSKKGAHGLPLMGSGDWNDGMNRVGIKGKGESVWLGMFLCLVLQRFADICLEDGTERDYYRKEADTLLETIRTQFENDRYLRGYFDNGAPLGSGNNTECRIDLLPQAFAAFLLPKDPKSRIAMESAYKELFDSDARILKLFTPPFDIGEGDPGYIKGYLPGIRENGGQYTHGAMWGAMAFFALNMNNEGYAVLCGSNPAARTLIPSLAGIYRLEPYALAGDIYAGEHAGRGGWSQYTGAAGWFFTAVLKGMLGYRCQNGKITLCPHLPDSLPTAELKYDNGTKVICHSLCAQKDNKRKIDFL